MFTTAMIAALATMSGARAENNELDLELGAIHTSDTDWEMFSDAGSVSTWGIRAGYGLSEHLSVVASWHHSADGAEIYFDNTESYDGDPAFHTAFMSDQFAVGPKFNYAVNGWLAPYGTAQLMAWRGKIRLDSDVKEEGNLGEQKFAALAPGAVAALGVEWMPFRLGEEVKAATHLELGYAYMLPMKFHDADGTERVDNTDKPAFVGEMDFQGFYMRWGVGLRF